MKKKEAELLIGNVIVTSFVKGTCYYAELLELTDSKPFRAKVRVLGIQRHGRFYSHHTAGGFLPYEIKTYVYGDLLDTGCHIETTDLVLEDFSEDKYADSLVESLQQYLVEIRRTLGHYQIDSSYHSCYIYSKKDALKLERKVVERIAAIDRGETFYFNQKRRKGE